MKELPSKKIIHVDFIAKVIIDSAAQLLEKNRKAKIHRQAQELDDYRSRGDDPGLSGAVARGKY